MKLLNVMPYILKRGILCVCLVLTLFSCRKSQEEQLAEALENLEVPDYSGEVISDETRALIADAVRTYKNEVVQDIRDTESLGLLYKRLAKKYMELGELNLQIGELAIPGYSSLRGAPRDSEYYYKLKALKSMDSSLYGKAFENIKKAIELDPGNNILYYLGGVCAGWMAKSYVDPDDQALQEDWLLKAELFYKRAIELVPEYVDALYALSVLLVFETDGQRLREAEEYTARILKKEVMNTKAYFLMAIIYDEMAVYYGNTTYYERAIQQYNRILEYSRAPDIEARAKELKEIEEDKLYGSN